MTSGPSNAVAEAVRKELSYLRDNLYRWRKMGGGYGQQDREIRDHEERIAQLEEEARALGLRIDR